MRRGRLWLIVGALAGLPLLALALFLGLGKATPTPRPKPAEFPLSLTSSPATNPTSTQEPRSEILNLIDEDPADIRVCDHLEERSLYQRGDDDRDLAKEAMNYDSRRRDDAVAEAWRVPWKTFLQLPAVREFFWGLHHIQQLPAEGHDRLTVLRALSLATWAFTEAWWERKLLNNQANRALHLTVLVRLVALRPQALASASEACAVMERAMLDGGRQDLDVRAEREELLTLLAAHELSPTEIGFDPKYYIDVTAEIGDLRRRALSGQLRLQK